MGRQYFLHFIDVLTEAFLDTGYFDEKKKKISTRVQLKSLLTCCLIFNTNSPSQLHLHFTVMGFPLDILVTGCDATDYCHSLAKTTRLTS